MRETGKLNSKTHRLQGFLHAGTPQVISSEPRTSVRHQEHFGFIQAALKYAATSHLGTTVLFVVPNLLVPCDASKPHA